MAVRIPPGYRRQLINDTLIELAAREAREKAVVNQYNVDICDWIEREFYIPYLESPLHMPLHQKAVLRYPFTRGANGHYPFQTITYSSIKKSGKSTIAGAVGRYIAETQTRYAEIFCIGNDLDQAKDRSYKEIMRSIELTPGYNKEKSQLPGRWGVQKTSMRCYPSGSVIHAIAVDAKGEAGGQPTLTIWTELWGFEDTDAKRFWDEMTPINTVPDSMRLIETYAGFDGESELLRGLYDMGIESHQFTAGELAALVCRNDVEGETYEDFVNCWYEARGNPDAKVPVWENKHASFFMYWDSGMAARRMPWQHMYSPISEADADERPFLKNKDPELCVRCFRPKPEHEIGQTADMYYAHEESTHKPPAFRRHHFNEWVGAESAFVPIELFDACGNIHQVNPIQPGDRTMLIAGADAAVTGDCFGAIVVSRCSESHDDCVDIRGLRKWSPEESGGVIQLDVPEQFLRQACKDNNIVQIAYDPYQLESIAQRFRREGVTWMEPFSQVGERLKSDSQLYDLIVGKRIHYSHEMGCPGGESCSCKISPLREHIANANGKVQTDEDSKIRIVKKSAGRKIDLAVALSMAAYRCLQKWL